MGALAIAAGDASISFLWELYVTMMRPVAVFILSHIFTTSTNTSSGSDGEPYEFFIVMALLAVNVLVFDRLAGALGGAFWNPTALLAFYSVGATHDNLASMAIRLPAQAVGAVGGVLAAKALAPLAYRHLLGGPRLLVGLDEGIVAESVLTFVITFLVLVAVIKYHKNRAWMIILASYAVILLGGSYTGPSLNPVHAFAWAYVYGNPYSVEHLFVFWLAPLVGTLLASWAFSSTFADKNNKEKVS